MVAQLYRALRHSLRRPAPRGRPRPCRPAPAAPRPLSPAASGASSGRMNSCTASAASMPAAENTPDTGLISTRAMPRSRATSTACSGPPPPNAISARSRGSLPRSTVTARIARAMLTLATWRMPCAASSTASLSGRATCALHRALRQRGVHRERTAGERARVEKAQHHVGVGDGRLLACRGRSRPAPDRRPRFPARPPEARRHRCARSSRRRSRPRRYRSTAPSACSPRP